MEKETQEITEIIEEVTETLVLVESELMEAAPIEEIPIEAVTETGLWTSFWDIYVVGLDWIFPFMMIVGAYIVLRHLLWNSLKFNYFHYLEYGEFVLAWGDDDGNMTKKERREKIANQIKMQEGDFASWFAALAMSLVTLGICSIIAIFWPITVILVFPLMVVRAIGYHKRKKIAFTQKLKGEHLAKEERA